MAKKDPAFLMYYRDILVGCATWKAEDLGWYLRLLCYQADSIAGYLSKQTTKNEAQGKAQGKAKDKAQGTPQVTPIDDTYGLPSDVEELAVLAGVKYSDYERFMHSFKHTLQAQFKMHSNGKLYNEKLLDVMLDRADYITNQSVRGYIGSFIKKIKAHMELPKDVVVNISNHLKTQNIDKIDEASRYLCYKRTLEAYIAIENADAIINSILTSLKTKNEKSKPINFAAQRHEILDRRIAEAKAKVDKGRKSGS